MGIAILMRNTYRHMQEDLDNLNMEAKNVTDMTDEEKNFFYFKLHDSDNNDVLDGLELLQAATHHTTHNAVSDHHHSTGNDQDEINHIIGKICDLIECKNTSRNIL